ncbi:MAG: TatD family hydrolase [Candidatus Cryosericum sp.]|nr:TatD family hydrolase [bacterium]
MNETMLVDTHAHVQMPEFDADRAEVLGRSRSAGVQWMVCPGVDLASSTRAEELARQEPDVAAAIGVHPEDCDKAPADYLTKLRSLYALNATTTVAIGEIGLDYKEGTPDRALQFRFFEEQLQLAADLALPVIVHSRFAVTACLNAVAHFRGMRGVMHCFGGTTAELERAVALGLHVSFTGNITYPGAHATRDALKACPVERLLLETDSPYMPPVPMRGTRNEPSFVAYVYSAAATLLDSDVTDVACRIHETARGLFNHHERGNHAGEENL